MSTPTINTAATQGLARVVTSLEHQVREPRHSPLPELTEVLQLAESMRAFADPGIETLMDKLWSAADAIDKAEAQVASGHSETADLLDLEPETITERVLDSIRDRAAREALAYQNAWHFRDALARTAGAALKDAADTVVANLRPDFDKHAKVVAQAAKVGISEHADAAELLASATPEQITAFRGVTAAATALDQIAGRRNEMTRVLRYGPAAHAALSFVTELTMPSDIDYAQSQYDGTTEVVQYNQDHNGSALTRVHKQRLGGRWLALANAGFKLHLNTAAETEAVIAASKGR